MHFVIFGVLIFIGHGIWDRYIQKSDYTIHISAEELERQAVIFAGENRRQPTDEDLKGLLFAHVEEQALMREARRLGLDEDDTIIRRRLAQKMRFMIEDVEVPDLPSEAKLREWFEDEIEQFVRPETRSFSHIFLSPESRGEETDKTATALLETVNDANWRDLGDPFMMQRVYHGLNQGDVLRLFGPNFAQQLFSIDNRTWTGPVHSAFGVHLVQINKVTEQFTPSFEEVQTAAEQEWQEQARRAANRDRLETLIKKYKVNTENLSE